MDLKNRNEFCHSCKVISCSSFANQDGWEAEKLCNSVQTGVPVKNQWVEIPRCIRYIRNHMVKNNFFLVRGSLILSKTPHFHKEGPSRKLRVSAKI